MEETKDEQASWLNELLFKYDGRVWSACRTRKPMLCIACKEIVPPKSHAFRPTGNGMDRQDRLHSECAMRLPQED